MLASGLAFGLIITLMVGFWGWVSYRDSLARAASVTEGYTLTYKAFSEQVFGRISGIVGEVNHRLDVSAADQAMLGDYVREQATLLPVLSDVVILDAQGRVRLAGRAPPRLTDRAFPVADRLLGGRDEPGMVVTPLFHGDTDGGPWVFAVGRTLIGADGTVAGAVAAVIDQTRLNDSFAVLLENDMATVVLAHAEGKILARVPEAGFHPGAALVSVVEREGVVVERRSGITRSSLDGVVRIFNERRLSGYPLLVIGTIAKSAALSDWYDWMILGGLLAGTVLVADVWVTVQLMRQLGRRRTAEARLSLQNAVLTSQRETSPDGILVADLSWRLISWNQRFLDIWRVSDDLMHRSDGRVLLAQIEPLLEDALVFRDDVVEQMTQAGITDDGTEIRLRDGRVLERFSRGLPDGQNGYWGRVWFYRDVTGRKRAEEALRRSERRYRAIFESVGDGLLVLDTEGVVIDGNQAGFAMHGGDADQMIGTLPDAWVDPVSLPHLMAFLRAVNANGDFIIEAVHRHLIDGQPFHAEVRGVPFDYAGRSCVLMMVRDITSRRAAEAALRVSEQRFRDVTDSVGELIYEVDPDLRITFITGRAPDQLGLEVDEVLGRTLFDLMHPEDRERIEPLVRSLVSRAVRFADVAFRVSLPEGGQSWQLLSGVPVMGEGGICLGYRGACMDITQSRQREMALRDANEKLERQAREMSALAERLELSRREIMKVQERFDLAVRGTNDGLWDWDIAAGRLYLSPRSKAILGYGDDEVGDDPAQWRRLVHADDLDETIAAVDDHLAGRSEYYRRILRFQHKLGHYVWILDRGMALRDRDGRPLRMVGTHSDITEMRRYEEALQAAKVDAETANLAKSQFLAVMSHEIRTPMTGILGMGDLLLSSGLNEEQEKYGRTLMRSARTLLGLLDDVLDFSKIEAGQLELEVVDFSPVEVVQDVIGLFLPKASERGLVLSSRLPEGAPPILRGDPTRLRQVLFNLVGNAVKFTARGGVDVCMDVGEGVGEEVALTLAIVDSGVGMDARQRARLFTPFTQADVSTTRRFGGTGLGLTICKRLVEMMGGTIEIDSALGEGSTFRVRLMLAEGDASKVVSLDGHGLGHSLDLPGPRAPGRRILLVEDNDTNRLLIATVLERSGHSVDTAADGRQGVEAVSAAAEPYDLILMDMQMPEMDGPDATRAIRALSGPAAHTPIVALTADVRAEDRDRYLASGLDDLLTKPVDWTRLREVIERLTGPGQIRPEPRPGRDKVLERASWEEEPVFDGSVLASLAEQLGTNRLRPLITSAMANLSRHFDQLEKTMATGSPQDVRRSAHALKGMAGQFGARRAQALSLAIEEEADRPQAARALLPFLRIAIEGARGGLEALVDSNPAPGEKRGREAR